jgi:hypothetical protein
MDMILCTLENLLTPGVKGGHKRHMGLRPGVTGMMRDTGLRPGITLQFTFPVNLLP